MEKEKLYLEAIYLEENGEIKKAIELYKEAANSNHIPSKIRLVDMYIQGNITLKQDRHLRLWKQQAKEEAEYYLLGKIYWYYKDFAEACKCFEKAAYQGNKEAMEYVIECYRFGIGIKKDENKANIWEQIYSKYIISAICIENKEHIKILKKHMNENDVDETIILLLGYYAISENGFRDVLETIKEYPHQRIHIIHEGLSHDMSVYEYMRIFNDYDGYFLEDSYIFGNIEFHANEVEEFRWNDEGIQDLLNYEKENTIYVSTVYEQPEWTINNIIYLKGGDIRDFSFKDGKLNIK